MSHTIINFLSVIVFLLSLSLVILHFTKKSKSSLSEGFRYDPYYSSAYYRDGNNNPEYVSEYSQVQGTGGGYANTYVPFGENNTL